jgi:hypothetical protein
MAIVPDSLVIDLVLPANAQPTPEQLIAGLGGEDVAQTRMIVDVDHQLPQYEQEISPTVPLRGQREQRVLVIDDKAGPMRKNPRREPIITRDLRPEKKRAIDLVVNLGARFARVQALGAFGDAVVVVRSARDLRGLMLLGWALDPMTDVDGVRLGRQLGRQEFELKLSAYDKRLDELDDKAILDRVAPAALEKVKLEGGKELLVVSVISDRDGSWDVRKSYEVEQRVAAIDQFSKIPGARKIIEPPPEARPAPADELPRPEPPKPAGPPIVAVDGTAKVILKIPAERFDLDAMTALGRKNLDLIAPHDQISGKQKDRIHHEGCGFVAPLAFLSEVFLDGKPLDKKRFEAEAKPVAGGRALEAHLPRFGAVQVIDLGGKRWVSSEPAADVLPLIS